MQNHPTSESQTVSRRQFIKSSSLVAASAAAAANFPPILHAQTKKPINAVVIGGGGRGRGAGLNFMDAAKAVGVEAKIVGVCEAFQDRLDQCLNAWQEKGIVVPKANSFVGLDGYKKVLEIPGVNYVIIATPPGFKPAQFKAAVEAGKHIFTEKPVAVDGPGCRIMFAAGELAKKRGLKVAAGTQRRHHAAYLDTVKRIQDGAIGDITFMRAYWVNGGPIWHRGDTGATDLEKQIRNWYHYIWLCGDHICEQHVHNIDVCNWIMKDHPVKCWGQGSRQQLGDKSGEIWDNFDVEFEYANGVRMFSYCGQIKREWSSISEGIHGTKGFSECVNGRNFIRGKDGSSWRADSKFTDPYVQEHIDLINAILKDTPMNETKTVTDSTLTAIMGREAAYSGAAVDWETIQNSKFAYGPELLYQDAFKLQWGAFRTLKPPMPSVYNILKEPPSVPVVGA